MHYTNPSAASYPNNQYHLGIAMPPIAWDRRLSHATRPLTPWGQQRLSAEGLEVARRERTDEIHDLVHDLVGHVYGPGWGVELTVFRTPVWRVRVKKDTPSPWLQPWTVFETVDGERCGTFFLRFETQRAAMCFAARQRTPSEHAQAMIQQKTRTYDVADLEPEQVREILQEDREHDDAYMREVKGKQLQADLNRIWWGMHP